MNRLRLAGRIERGRRRAADLHKEHRSTQA
jgi:hypothetical protein